MDQQNQNTSAASAAREDVNRDTETNIQMGEASFDELMRQSPTLCPLSGWLKCLRKPAISLQYSMQKRHIPDLDKDNRESGQTGASSAQKGQNSDTMDVTGGFTIRYFDLLAGAMGLLLLGCVWKGCCGLKRVMK